MNKILNITNIHALDVWGKRIWICTNKIFFLCFFSVYSFRYATLSLPFRLRHQTSATRLRYLRSFAFYRQPFDFSTS